MKILVTGFEPFGDLAANPSASIVEELARRHPQLHTAVLPTAFDAAARAVSELLQSDAFDVYLALGVAARTPFVRVERTARNVDDAKIADNAGEQRTGTHIVVDGPDCFTSTLPVAELLAALQDSGIDAVVSDDAGGYVCNHVFYTARHVIERDLLPTRCGFIHVPLDAERIVDADDERQGVPLADLVEAVERCLRVLQCDEPC